jgi:hypothetical protein
VTGVEKQLEIANLIIEHNGLLEQVCQLQKRNDADRFKISYDPLTGFFDRAGGSYDADTIRMMIRSYKGMLDGTAKGFACNPNPYDGVWK